jgi:hypothetical protein
MKSRLASAPARRNSSGLDVWLDYKSVGRKAKFLPNLSAIAVAGQYLWTASDEMRTIECLAPTGGGYQLSHQFALDTLFPELPGRQAGHEADIEALDVADGHLWLTGSHALTRRAPKKVGTGRIEPTIRKRLSRRLLGSLPLEQNGAGVRALGQVLPFKGPGSLRAVLAANPYTAPFMELPSKENGLDIEGLTIFRNQVYLGLRGPVIDNIAIIAAIGMRRDAAFDAATVLLNFVDLGGLGVRDLTRWQGAILILAGPVSSADGPFALYKWSPHRSTGIQKVQRLCDLPSGLDHPEAICPLRRNNRDGWLIVYDSRNPARVKGTRYRAHWIGAERWA